MRALWIAFGALLTGTLGVTTVNAHHSFAASFTDERIMREGVVERYVFRNPHVLLYIAVTDDDGASETWMVEGSSATGLRSAGWSADTLSIGDHVRINGRAGRNNRPMISMESVAVLDPESKIVLRDLPLENFADSREPAEILSLALTRADGLPNLTGTWGRGRGRPAFFDHRAPPFNEAGAALQAEWDPADDPQVACEDPTLIRQAGFTPHPVRIEQFDDRVVLSYEEYGGVRTIHFDGRDAGQPGDDHLKLGRSTARYESDRLIIESTHITAGPTGTPGHQLTDRVTTVETYRRLDDPTQGPMVEMEMIINDPGHLYEPWEMVWKKLYQENYEFIEVECHIPYLAGVDASGNLPGSVTTTSLHHLIEDSL